MERKILKNKPLMEAIFEMQWKLQGPDSEMGIDPYYKILIGRIYDRVKDEYPFYEPLQTVDIPDEIARYIVQYRFRKGENKWPLIQIGPGVITLNDTEEYVWEDFEERIHRIVNVLFEVYPDAENNLRINHLLLRYIDAIEFNYEEDNIFSFLKKNLKVNIELYEELFEGTEIENLPSNFDLRFSFPAIKPKGTAHLRFVRGKKKSADALIWETMVQSVDEDVPKDKDQIIEWGVEAHQLTDNLFFKMIEGELLRRFE
ncbi:MAG TPA: TIGR04255 family protein [Dictyoglomaceae bacterium]|nr:TIGR04255 family protein [Dictyoglomaceae bacterium]HOL40121.1 TIGR04255 family protein [Dictyoglomaceae bacterium]HPP16663.1 TIGR04255 family protein [Dictyoglomaceae bacterium]